MLVIGVFTRAQDVLGACVVGMLIQHPAPTIHLNGIAATKIWGQVRTVSTALMTTALEVLVFKERNLDRWIYKNYSVFYNIRILWLLMQIRQAIVCTLFTQTAFVPYLHHCYWYCLPAIQLQLCCGLYWKVECADEGKLLSSKLPWFAYQQNGLVKFDFPLSTCDSLISKKCQMWHVKVLLLDDKCVVVFSTEFLVSVSTLFLYTWKSFGYLSTFTVCFLQDEITNAFYHEGKKKQGSYFVLDDCWLYLTLKIGSLAAFVNNLYPYLSCSCQWFMYFAR